MKKKTKPKEKKRKTSKQNKNKNKKWAIPFLYVAPAPGGRDTSSSIRTGWELLGSRVWRLSWEGKDREGCAGGYGNWMSPSGGMVTSQRKRRRNRLEIPKGSWEKKGWGRVQRWTECGRLG